jgi:photosystem II stability/assembly factor-like uncharacterized protein
VEPGCCGSPFTFAANGRVNSIAVDPTNSNVLYLGSAGGGVWKTVDGGAHWTPKTDQEISLGIGSSHAIAIDPNHPNTIYAGTSSWSLLNPGDRAQSRGILKSTDGGASWVVLGSGFPSGNVGNAEQFFRDRNISTILVDPADSQVLYLAAGRAGDAIAGGVFRSEDGGLNWRQGVGTQDLRVESLVLDASSPSAARVLYAGAETKGVLKSTDGGKTWTEVLKPSTVTTEAPNGFYKVMVALAPPASPPNPAGPVIYASLQLNDAASKNLLHVIFRNSNGGMEADWEKRNGQVLTFLNPDFSQLFGGGFSDMVVDPASPGDGVNDRIYWGGLSQYLSTDSGDTFDEIGQIHGIHGDHQTWLVVPHAGLNTVWVGDDGGIWRSDDAGATWTGTATSPPASLASTLNAGGLQTATLYQLAVQQDASATRTLAGTQDSGVLRLPLPPPVPALPAGAQPWSGTSNDGIDVAFEKVAPNLDVAYCIQNDTFFKSTDGGATWPTDFTSKLPESQVAIFINRLAVDPNNAGFVYVGGSAGAVLQSMDGAATNFRTLGNLGPFFVTSIDVAPGDSNHVVAASAAKVFVITNALADAVEAPHDITGDLPARFVTRVAFDPHDADVVYATLAGFGTGHVFTKSINATNWTDISPAVDIPVQSMALDGGSNPAILYVGTELGVLRRSVAGGGVWEVVDDLHLPNAAVSDLEINSQAGVLRAGTWGRGVFELAAPTGSAIFVAPPALEIEEACAVTGKNGTIGVSNVGTQDLVVSSVQRLAGSSAFTVLASPATPVTINPGGSATFIVHYTPTVPGIPESATIRITSNDPTVPFADVPVSGTLETTPPIINNLTAAPKVLPKPNHKMVPVTVTVAVTDNCDVSVAQSCRIDSVVSNEPVSGTGEGDTEPDWEITGSLSVNLRAERAGSGTGRIYTVFVRCTDNAGNSSGTATQVMVPH